MIYAIAEQPWDRPELVKIGFITVGPVQHGSAAARQRLRDLQTGNSRELAVIALTDGGRSEEKRLHREFAAYRIRRGRVLSEWFTVGAPLAAWLSVHQLENPVISIPPPKPKKERVVPSKNRCGYCKLVGHNTRNCEKRIAVHREIAREAAGKKIFRACQGDGSTRLLAVHYGPVQTRRSVYRAAIAGRPPESS